MMMMMMMTTMAMMMVTYSKLMHTLRHEYNLKPLK